MAGAGVMLSFESFWRDRPYLLAAMLSLASLVLGPWWLALANQAGLSVLAFYLFITPYHSWRIGSTVEVDYTLLYLVFLAGLDAAWFALTRARVQAESARRRAELEGGKARINSDLLRHVLETSPAAVVTLDVNGVVLYANQRAGDLIGLKEGDRRGVDYGGELFGRETLDGVPLPPSEGPFPTVLRAGRRVTLPRYRFRRPDGPWRIIETSGEPIRGSDGEIEAVAISVLDVTEAHEAEQRLRAQQERFDLIAATVPGVVYQFEATAGHSYGRYLYASARSVDYFGLTPEELARSNEPLVERIHPDDREAFTASTQRARTEGTPWRQDFRLQHPTRGTLWLRGAAIPSRLPDGRQVFNGIMLDITEQKKLELDFLQSQKLETVGRLAGGVAHDFNNILTAILGCAEALEWDYTLPAGATDELLDLKRAVDRAAGLTGQLLTISRQQIIIPRQVDVTQGIRELEKLLSRLVGADVAIVVVPSEEPCPVLIDPGQLNQILLNLAVNARDAMPQGGRLLMRTWREPPSEGMPRGAVTIEVSDTGQGMSAEVRSRIFEPFFTTKEPGKGTGLGLATVHDIVQRAGGTIAVESREGEGTTFRLRLPATSASPEPGTARPAERRRSIPGQRRLRVLLVEDDESIRRVLRRTLEEAGYVLQEARHGDEALALFQARRGEFDLLVTDVVMPGMSGPALAARLRENRAALPVLYLSGFASEHLEALTREDPRHRLLAKPFHRDEVLDAVESLTTATVAPR